jgi:hypothetical protein
MLSVILKSGFVLGITEAAFLIAIALTCRWSFVAYCRWKGDDSLLQWEKEHLAKKHAQQDWRAVS